MATFPMATGDYYLVIESKNLYVWIFFRLYYTRRSQPPVFTQLVNDYLSSKNDPTTERLDIASVVWHLDQEFKFWQTKMVSVNGHQLARYWVDVGGPRPG